MGYESKLIIVKKTKYIRLDPTDGKSWAERIAEINLSCVGNEASKLWQYPPTDCFYYNGNEAVLEDKYGKELSEIPIKDCIDILEMAEKADHYRRYTIALGLLKAFDNNDWDDGDIVVLHYGY